MYTFCNDKWQSAECKEEFALTGVEALADFMRKIGMPTSLRDEIFEIFREGY